MWEVVLTHLETPRVRVGVIGQGRLWEARYKQALGELSDRYQITAIYDQVARRAVVEAMALGCDAPEGLTATVDRNDVDLVFLLAPQWFGMHAARLARQAGKPVFSALPVACDHESLEQLARAEVRGLEAPFIPELARRFYPATRRLQELLATCLGPPRRIVGHARFFGYDRYGTPGPSTLSAQLPMEIDPGGNLLDWCCLIFQGTPAAIQAFGGETLPISSGMRRQEPAEDYGGFILDFNEGKQAVVTYERLLKNPWGLATQFLPTPGFQVFSERGCAWLEMPDRIQWTCEGNVHEELLPTEPSLGATLLDHLHRRLSGLQSLSPGIVDAVAASRLVQALLLSRREHRTVSLLPGT